MGEFLPGIGETMERLPSAAQPAVSGRAATEGFTYQPAGEDPYPYMQGFGNRFASESMFVTLTIILRHIRFPSVLTISKPRIVA